MRKYDYLVNYSNPYTIGLGACGLGLRAYRGLGFEGLGVQRSESRASGLFVKVQTLARV